MIRLLAALVYTVGVLFPLQLYAQAPDPAFYAVSYVETAPSSDRDAATAWRTYLRTARGGDGAAGVDLFEQIGRPGHWVLVERWTDQKAFDARNPAIQQQLLDALARMRISGFDQRPYKTVSVAPPRAPESDAISVIAHVDVAPNPAVATMLADLAAASRREPGNLRFDVLQHTMRGNHFTVVETWTDQKALDAHVTAAHTKAYRDQILPLTGSPLDERVFKAIR
jgi:quinol monooxygenase YgiN